MDTLKAMGDKQAADEKKPAEPEAVPASKTREVKLKKDFVVGGVYYTKGVCNIPKDVDLPSSALVKKDGEWVEQPAPKADDKK